MKCSGGMQIYSKQTPIRNARAGLPWEQCSDNQTANRTIFTSQSARIIFMIIWEPLLKHLCRPANATKINTTISTYHTFAHIFEAVKEMFMKNFKPPLERLCRPAWVLCCTALLSPMSQFESDCE